MRGCENREGSLDCSFGRTYSSTIHGVGRELLFVHAKPSLAATEYINIQLPSVTYSAKILLHSFKIEPSDAPCHTNEDLLTRTCGLA